MLVGTYIVRLGAFLLAVAVLPAAAQSDLTVTAITAPRSGCALSASEVVTVQVFNYGTALPAGTMFNASYTINAGAPATEPIVLANSFLSHSTLTYTFATQADLSAPGSYYVDATVSLPGDANPANDAFTGYVVANSAPSVGGSVSGTTGPTMSGSVSLIGQVGSVVEWQQSEDGGLRWRRLSNTATTQTFNRLREHTQFRAMVRSGSCAPALSSPQQVLSSDPIFYSGFEP